MPEKTLLLVKPDGVARGLEDQIFNKVESAGLKIVRRKKMRLTPALAADLYSPHLGKSFYQGLINFITSGEVIPCELAGENAILRTRELMGATDPREAAPGTIRGDLKEANIFTSDGSIKNLVHGSDSPDSAKRELDIFFGG